MKQLNNEMLEKLFDSEQTIRFCEEMDKSFIDSIDETCKNIYNSNDWSKEMGYNKVVELFAPILSARFASILFAKVLVLAPPELKDKLTELFQVTLERDVDILMETKALLECFSAEEQKTNDDS